MLSTIRFIASVYDSVQLLKNYPVFDDSCGYIYCFAMDVKMFKVGRTGNPLRRLNEHAKSVNTYSRMNIKAFCLAGPFVNVCAVEEQVKASLRPHFKLSSGEEWFLGPFDKGITKINLPSKPFIRLAIPSVLDWWVRVRTKQLQIEHKEIHVADLYKKIIYPAGKFNIPQPQFIWMVKNVLPEFGWLTINRNEYVSIDAKNRDKVTFSGDFQPFTQL